MGAGGGGEGAARGKLGLVKDNEIVFQEEK